MQPKINDYLFIQMTSLDEEETIQEYKSRIADIQDQYLTIEVPINVNTGRLKRLETGEQLSVYYMNSDGVKHYFNSDVLGMKSDVIRLYVIKKPNPEAITKVQRRHFLRVPAELEISVNLQDKLNFICYTLDIGGGGVSFTCSSSHPIKEQDELMCYVLIHFKNGTIEHCKFVSEVVRVKPIEHSSQQTVMTKFIEIDPVEQQKIIRYCFERQIRTKEKIGYGHIGYNRVYWA